MDGFNHLGRAPVDGKPKHEELVRTRAQRAHACTAQERAAGCAGSGI